MHTVAASEGSIWSEAETLPREQLCELQLQRLRELVGEIGSLEDVPQLPFTVKSDLRAAYPFGLLKVPREQLMRVHASSGTHGKPTVVGYTRGDLETWTELMARCMTMAGVRPGMLVHNANGYGLFTGGLGFHQGGERIGCTMVPVSGGFTARQALLLRDFGSQVLVATPSYALAIAQAVVDEGYDVGELRLELGLFGAEPWSEAMRAQIEQALGLTAVNFYGLSEMCGPGVAAECLVARDGLHVQEDHFLVEVIDPESGARVPDGVEGELVLTTLTKEAMPLIRYRTADYATLDSSPCECGRTGVRLKGLRGRRDDMLIIRGVNVHPSSVEHVLLSVDGTSPHYQLVIERRGALDELTLECEPRDGGADREAMRALLAHRLRDNMGVRIGVRVLDPGTVPRSVGKAVRIVDRRASSPSERS